MPVNACFASRPASGTPKRCVSGTRTGDRWQRGAGPLADAGARGLECRGRPQRAVQRHQSYFLTPTLTRQTEAEQALVNGDPGPRLAMTSTNDPVTVFGAKV